MSDNLYYGYHRPLRAPAARHGAPRPEFLFDRLNLPRIVSRAIHISRVSPYGGHTRGALGSGRCSGCRRTWRAGAAGGGDLLGAAVRQQRFLRCAQPAPSLSRCGLQRRLRHPNASAQKCRSRYGGEAGLHAVGESCSGAALAGGRPRQRRFHGGELQRAGDSLQVSPAGNFGLSRPLVALLVVDVQTRRSGGARGGVRFRAGESGAHSPSARCVRSRSSGCHPGLLSDEDLRVVGASAERLHLPRQRHLQLHFLRGLQVLRQRQGVPSAVEGPACGTQRFIHQWRQNVRHGHAGVCAAAVDSSRVGSLHRCLEFGAVEDEDVGERQAHSDPHHISPRDALRGNHQTEDRIHHLRVRRVHLRVHAAVPCPRPCLDDVGHHVRRAGAGAGADARHLGCLLQGLRGAHLPFGIRPEAKRRGI